VTEVHHARYLLQPRALQLFFQPLSGHAPALLAAPTGGDMTAIAAAAAAGAPDVPLYDRRKATAAAAVAARRWASGEMSNFDYLMLLNTLSGRSHADLAQYPVFPWVVADWVSESLDLGDPRSFRDLSRPIGALNEDRLERFRERYASLQGDDSVAPFFFGTHYSSAGIVLWYLLRLEPFAKLAHALQARPCRHAAFPPAATLHRPCSHSARAGRPL
jgi:neurobeachin-like protein 1/2